MKYILLFLCFLSGLLQVRSQQRVIADCTITYSIVVIDSSKDKAAIESLKKSSKTVYIKGNDSRTDLVSPSFTQSLLFNKGMGTAVILRSFGNNKFMTVLDNTKWVAENSKYDGMKISFESKEVKTILGYECKKAVIQLKNGSNYSLFYAIGIVPSVKEFEYQFKDIPGFVFEFESLDAEGNKIMFLATKINLSPVQDFRFDIPTTGYRILN